MVKENILSKQVSAKELSPAHAVVAQKFYLTRQVSEWVPSPEVLRHAQYLMPCCIFVLRLNTPRSISCSEKTCIHSTQGHSHCSGSLSYWLLLWQFLMATKPSTKRGTITCSRGRAGHFVKWHALIPWIRMRASSALLTISQETHSPAGYIWGNKDLSHSKHSCTVYDTVVSVRYWINFLNTILWARAMSQRSR